MSEHQFSAEVVSKTLKEKPVGNGGTITQVVIGMRYGHNGFEAKAELLMDQSAAEGIELGEVMPIGFRVGART